MSKKCGSSLSVHWLGILALLGALSCEVPEDPGQLTLYVDRIPFPGVVSLKLHVDRIDVVMSTTPDGPEQIITLTDEDRVIETIGAPGLPSSEVYTGYIEPGYLKQLRVIATRAVAVFATGEVGEVKLPSQAQTGEKLVPHEEVCILDGQTTRVTLRLDPERTIITPPGQGLLIKPVLTMLLREIEAPPVNEYTPGLLLLWFKETATEEEINGAIEEIGARVVWSDLETLWFVIELPDGMTEADGRDALLLTGLVDTYTLDWIGVALYEPLDDEYYTTCFLDRIKATATAPGISSLDVYQGDSDVIVAVIDNGLALEDIGPPYGPFNDFVSSSTGLSKLWLNPGEDLDAVGQKPGDGVLTISDFNDVDDDDNGVVDDLNGVYFYCFYSLGESHIVPFNDFYTGPAGHGTAVTSIIAAEVDNDSTPGSLDLGEEMVGICPNVTIMPINVFGERDTVTFKGYFAAQLYAKRHGAHITSSSLGFPVEKAWWDILGWDFDSTVRQWEKAWAKLKTDNILHVFAAGNEGTNIKRSAREFRVFPAELQGPNLITVGGTIETVENATTYVEKHALSNYSKTLVDLGAPWEALGLWSNGVVYPFEMTSAATPQVTAVAALLMGQRPELRSDPALVRDILLANVTKHERLANVFLSEGRLDALKCVSAPLVTITGVPATATIGETVTFEGGTSTDAGGNNIVSYKWTFGDGADETGAFADVDTTHVYTASGTYEVRLELTDDLAPEPATGIARVWITIE